MELFTKKQIGRAANILDNAGQVFVATLVLPLLTINADTPGTYVLPIGVILATLCWWISLRLERRISQ